MSVVQDNPLREELTIGFSTSQRFDFDAAEPAIDDSPSPALSLVKTAWCCGNESGGEQDTDKATEVGRALDAPANFHQAAAVYLLGGSTAKYTGAA